MIVHIPYDIPQRVNEDATWVEAGDYKVLRQIDDTRYLIILSQHELYRKQRQLTIVREDEIEF